MALLLLEWFSKTLPGGQQQYCFIIRLSPNIYCHSYLLTINNIA